MLVSAFSSFDWRSVSQDQWLRPRNFVIDSLIVTVPKSLFTRQVHPVANKQK